MKDFYDVFVTELKRAYSAESQLIKALPIMAKSASSSKLKEAFHHHHEETIEQLERLKVIETEINEDLSGIDCESMRSLIEEASLVIKAGFDPAAKDSALIVGAQRIEHYEIASYGSLKAFAKHLKIDVVFKLLETTEKEEAHADKLLTAVAEGNFLMSGINDLACKKCT